MNMNNVVAVEQSIIVFDGMCDLCHGAVNFIILRNHKNNLMFTPMQSSVGQRMLAIHNISSDNIDTFLLVKHGKAYTKSSAALAIAKELKSPWNYLVILRFIPISIRDYVYSLIAGNRYKWFGKRKECLMMVRPEFSRHLI